MTNVPICPCDGFTHPAVLYNLPGQAAIAYRIGTYSTFRQALLQALENETELTQWRPGAKRDLALQMVEWWAYLADILTFYNERIANESYLRTADLPESMQRLTQILGYRPRPGIAARGVVAALMTHSKSFSLPQGFQIQSKPGPGKQPQIFELDGDTQVQFPDAIAVEPVANPALLQGNSVLLKGRVSTVKAGDELLLLKKDWTGSDHASSANKGYDLLTVQKVDFEKDPKGKTNTRITFNDSSLESGFSNAQAQDYRLLKSDQYTQVWPYPTDTIPVVSFGQVHLISLIRQIKVGDSILLKRSEKEFQLVQVTEYHEIIWYANPMNNDPTSGVAPPGISIPIPHTELRFSPILKFNWNQDEEARAAVLVYYNWQDIGELIATPVATISITKNLQVSPSEPYTFPTSKSTVPVLLEDADGNGTTATLIQGNSSTYLHLSNLSDSAEKLSSPLNIFFNLLTVSRGQTVPTEVLGSGNASFANQEFVLKKSPLTYLLDPAPSSGKDYKSTLRIWVNDIEWQEVPSFYGQPANAHIFVAREDIDQKTHVLFGDGINGARLPTGIDNVVATYRYGSGKESPDAGSLNVIAKPYPNLKAIRNPVQVGGGADPDPPDQIRRYAPQSVLTFDRAVSGDDYEVIAAQAPGVARARAYWTWDSDEQRSLVVIYVGDDIHAVTAANMALKNAADPNRPVVVKQATAIPIRLQLSVRIEPTYTPEPVLADIEAALLDVDTGLFGSNNVQIGQSVYQSQIYAVCLQVPGVVAVHKLQVLTQINGNWILSQLYRHDAGIGKFYQLPPENLLLNAEVTQ